MPNERLASILDRSGDAPTVAWAHEGVGTLTALPDPELAIEAAAALGNTAALASVQQPKNLRKLAAASLHKLRSKGVRVEVAAVPKSFTLAGEAVTMPPRAFLSVPNELGNHHLILTATDNTGSCIMELIVGGEKLQDHHGHASRSELRSFWKEIQNDGTMKEIPFLVGLHLGLQAVRGQRAHGWEHLIEKLDKGSVPAAERVAIQIDSVPQIAELADVDSWGLPAGLVPGKVVAAALSAMPKDTTGDEGRSWSVQFATEALSAARPAFAAAARKNAQVFSVLGHRVSASKSLEIAEAIDAGAAGGSFPEMIIAVNFAVLREMQHRQVEQRQDLDAMMQALGRQGGKDG